ncbi:MAG: hypothetical protein ACR2HJ_00385 [Fimbriimonadales bacterium]
MAVRKNLKEFIDSLNSNGVEYLVVGANAGGGGAAGRGMRGVVNAIDECLDQPMGKARFGKAAHNVIEKGMEESGGFKAEEPLRGSKLRPDLTSTTGGPDLELKPGSHSGVGKGLSQVGKYEEESGIPHELVPYPVPWAPDFWDTVPDIFHWAMPHGCKPRTPSGV